MKRMVALLAALVLLLASAVPAFAADDVEYTSVENAGSVNTTLTYGVSQSYMIKIPSRINLHRLEDGSGLGATATVEAKSVIVAGDESLNIAVNSSNETSSGTGHDVTFQWWLKDTNMKVDGVTPASVPVKYTATIPEGAGTAQLYNGKKILTVGAAEGDKGTESNAGGSVTITFFTEGTAQHGAYQDILTFHVSVDKDGVII